MMEKSVLQWKYGPGTKVSRVLYIHVSAFPRAFRKLFGKHCQTPRYSTSTAKHFPIQQKQRHFATCIYKLILGDRRLVSPPFAVYFLVRDVLSLTLWIWFYLLPGCTDPIAGWLLSIRRPHPDKSRVDDEPRLTGFFSYNLEHVEGAI